MTDIKKTEKHRRNISKGRKTWIAKNREQFDLSMKKMKLTKERQSNLGILSEKHYTNNKTKEDVNDIYSKIVEKSNITKNNKKMLGIYPDVWNKGKSKFNDVGVAKYSGENHYLWNPNKLREYDEKFYDSDYRLYLLERQNNKCLICDSDKNDKTFCLHHIDKNKKNSDDINLIYVCRSCHSIIHNNYDIMTNQIMKEMLKMGYLNNSTVTVEAIEMSSHIAI